jgi:hypothetical protein
MKLQYILLGIIIYQVAGQPDITVNVMDDVVSLPCHSGTAVGCADMANRIAYVAPIYGNMRGLIEHELWHIILQDADYGHIIEG